MWKPIDPTPEHPLEAEIVSLVAQSHKLTHDLLTRLREFDEARGWAGFASCAEWPHEQPTLAWFQFTLRGCALTWNRGALYAGLTDEGKAQPGIAGSNLITGTDEASALAEVVAKILAARADAPFDGLKERLSARASA